MVSVRKAKAQKWRQNSAIFYGFRQNKELRVNKEPIPFSEPNFISLD